MTSTDTSREAVERVDWGNDGEMVACVGGEFVYATAYDALLARAEKAEADRLAMAQRFDEHHPDPSLMALIILKGNADKLSVFRLTAERDALQAENDRLRANCGRWLELAERTAKDHGCRLDANRLADFMQGIRETRTDLGHPTP